MTSRRSLDDLAARLVESCSEGFDAPWVEALRTRADDFAVATGGAPVVIEVAFTGKRAFRIAILSDGQLHVPIGKRGPFHFRLQGDPHEVARFVLGDGTLLDAQARGVLVFGSPRPAIARLVRRLRGLAAGELRGLLELPAVVAIGARRWTARLQRVDHPIPEAAYVANCVVTVALAVFGAVVGVPSGTATTNLATAPPLHAFTEPADRPLRPELHGPAPYSAAASPMTPRQLSSSTQSGQPSTRRTEIVSTASTPHAGNQNWTVLTVSCEHRTGRVLCAVLQQVPISGVENEPSATAVPGQAGR